MKYDPSKVEFKINGVAVDESIMTKLKHEVYSQVEFIMRMIDDGVINEESGIDVTHENENFAIKIKIDIK